LRTSPRARKSSTAPSRDISETSSRMVLGWIVRQWRRKDDHPVAPGCESPPHATVVAVVVSAPPATVVEVGVGVRSP
jgi:hypothetical protein